MRPQRGAGGLHRGNAARAACLGAVTLALAACIPGELSLAQPTDLAAADGGAKGETGGDGGGGGGGGAGGVDGGGAGPDGAVACTTCGADCVDLATDGTNCGACGHDCLGGACKAGVCQPVTLAAGQVNPWGIAADATTVYFTRNSSPGGGVLAVPLTGGTVTPFASAPSTVVSIALHAGTVFFPTSTDILACPAGPGGCAAPLSIATTNRTLWKLVADANHVYWMLNDRLMRTPVGLKAPTTFATSMAKDIALSGGKLYWTSWTTPSQLLSCPTSSDCASPSVLEANLASPGPLAISPDGATAYWAEGAELRSCALAGCASSKVGTLPFAAEALAVDGTHVYFLYTGGIGRCALAACNPVEIRKGYARAFVLDAVSVMWTEGANVFRLAK